MSPEFLPGNPEQVVRGVAAGVSRLVAEDLTPADREDELDRLAALYAEHTDVCHPLSPIPAPRLRTRSQVRQHFAAGQTRLADVERFEPVNAIVHVTDDPEVVIFEFAYAISVKGHAFRVPNIYVVRVRDGQIVESRDYVDHVGMARGLGHLDGLAAALTHEHGSQSCDDKAATIRP